MNTPPLFHRSAAPVLLPQSDISWASGAVFNPGAWLDESTGTFHFLFRAVPDGYSPIELDGEGPAHGSRGFENYVSSIGYATSRDLVHLSPRMEPFLVPDTPDDIYGVEDPRISRLGGVYLITYTALGSPAFSEEPRARIGLATTTDFLSATKHGVIGPDCFDKDAVIFPAEVGGKVGMLHRIVPDIQLALFDSIDELLAPPAGYWEKHLETLDNHVVMRPAFDWESRKIGAGPTPIETPDGWLLIYHGVDEENVYRMGIALLDREEPKRVIARARRPVLEPEMDFEREGDIPMVVFPEGSVVSDGRLHVYYGAADRVIGHASAMLSDVLEHLREEAHPVRTFNYSRT
jgi:beta-1,2-mannobiose phosphorylase / 1,2-beta-oligomannan phosphorylase